MRACVAGGDSPYAVLDKLVPGYYHRRTEQGDICASCCCNNTASEHAMCERLIIDDIVHWARTYKVALAPLHPRLLLSLVGPFRLPNKDGPYLITSASMGLPHKQRQVRCAGRSLW